MNLTDDEILKFQRGSPVLFYDICAIYPTTLGEIVDLGYSKFQQYLGVLTSTKPVGQHTNDKELSQLIAQLTDFQYLIMMATVDETINQTLKDGFQFFTHENIIFSLEPPQIIIGPAEEKHILSEENFAEFQHLLRVAFFLEDDGDEIIINADDDANVRALKMKMRENREKLRIAKAKKARQEGSDLKFSDLIGSITINNCNLNMENIWNITYYAFHDQMKRMGWRDQFDINNKAALAGAKMTKKQLKHWMRSINSNDDK